MPLLPALRATQARVARSWPALLLVGGVAAAAGGAPGFVVFDLAPFYPDAVLGEITGVSTATGKVVGARIDVTFVSYEESTWVLGGEFVLPTGSAGFSSYDEGWDGAGTFTTSFETNAFNGELVADEGAGHYSWAFQWEAGTPVELPGGGVALTPVHSAFADLRLTLTFAEEPVCVPALWTDLGCGLAGASGTPDLAGVGDGCGSDPVRLDLSCGLETSHAFVVLGTSALELPIFGGTLVPAPDLVLQLAMVADSAASLELPFVSSFPPASSLWCQAWLLDPTAPEGLSASNALRLDLP